MITLSCDRCLRSTNDNEVGAVIEADGFFTAEFMRHSLKMSPKRNHYCLPCLDALKDMIVNWMKGAKK